MMEKAYYVQVNSNTTVTLSAGNKHSRSNFKIIYTKSMHKTAVYFEDMNESNIQNNPLPTEEIMNLELYICIQFCQPWYLIYTSTVF
jgi:hypothetical protein